MHGEPSVHVVVPVGPAVVQDHVHLEALGHFLIHLAQEPEKLAVGVAGEALADDLAGQDI